MLNPNHVSRFCRLGTYVVLITVLAIGIFALPSSRLNQFSAGASGNVAGENLHRSISESASPFQQALQKSQPAKDRPYIVAKSGEAFILRTGAGVALIKVKTTLPVFKSFGASADGTKLLYTPLKNGIPSGDLYVEDLSTQTLKQISTHLVMEAEWSPTDNKVAYTFASGEDFGLAVVDLNSDETVVLANSVFAPLLQWDDSGKGIHYFHATNLSQQLRLSRRYVTTGPKLSDQLELPALPSGFPVLEEHSFGKVFQDDTFGLSSNNEYSFQTQSSGEDYEISGDSFLANGPLYLRRTGSATRLSLGDGQLIKVLPDGLIVRRVKSQGTELEYINWNGVPTALAAPVVSYNLPLQNSTLIQGGQGYASPGSCAVGSHINAMAYAYDLESSTIGAHAMAAAGGLVVYSTSTVTCNMLDSDCADYSASGCPGTFLGNVVIIQHADGTFTKYAHMETNSPQVAVGTSVCQGLYIGRQGHTGTTNGTLNGCGDHLHFQRQSTPDIFGQSIAVDFSDVALNPLSCGVNYTSASTEVSHLISPSNQSFPIPGGNGTVNVTSTGCTWSATSNASWISITSPGSGTGNDVVGFSVADNSASGARVGTMTIGGHVFTVSQAGGGITNQAPVVNAGADQTITLPSNASLAGTANDDGLPLPPGAITSTWSKVSGLGGVTFGNANALNTSATFSLAGVYVLRLTVSDGTLSSFDDVTIIANTNTGAGLLAGSQAATPANVDLSTEGTVDWAHWGLTNETSFDHKSGVSSQISDYTRIGPIGSIRFSGLATTYTWSNGTPTSSASTNTGVFLYEVGNGFQLTVPADTTNRTLRLYLGLFKARGRLEATLSDGSASPIVDTSFADLNGVSNGVFTLTYRAGTTGQLLTIRWTVESVSDTAGNITLQSATLQSNVASGALSGSRATAPASVNLTTEGTTDWAHWGLTTETSFDHRSGVTSQISNYTLLGSGGAQRQKASPTSYSWSNGTPTVSASNTPTGVYTASTVGNGFQLAVPADTTDRALKLYVGLWRAQGRMEVILSDGSAATYLDTSLINQTDTSNAVYTLNYRAASNGQTLTIRWTILNAYHNFGNVTLQAATLVVTGGPPTNQAPTVNAGNDQTITLPNSASLSGTANDDGLPAPPGTLTTTWSKLSGPGTVTFGNANALSTTASFSVAGSYTLRLTASDSVLSSTDDMVVTVNSPSNQAPIVSAGGDQTITLPNSANLSGTASDDGLPAPPGSITTTWSKVSGPGTVTFGNANALSTTASFSLAGSYTLRLTANDSVLTTTDDLIVTVNPLSTGALSGSQAVAPASVNLTTEGTADWAHWGITTATSFDHLSGVTPQISNYSVLGSGAVLRQQASPTSYSWSNGTPTVSASNTPTGVFTYGSVGNGFQLTVPADTTDRTLKLYLGVWDAQGRLEATLSDGSAPVFVDTSLINQTATSNGVYTLNYRAGSSGQTLTIKWTINAAFHSFGNVTLQAATLAGGSPSGTVTEFQISSSAPFNQLVTHIASDPNGNFVVVWQDDGLDGNSWGIFARRYNAAGVPQGNVFQVNTLTAGSQFSPHVAMDSSGNFVIVWESEGADGSGYGISAQRYDAAGVPQGGEFQVNTTTPNNQLDPFIAMAPNGNFVVAWTSDLQDGSSEGMFAQRFNAAGVPQGVEFQVNTFTTDRQKQAGAAMDANGNFVIVWMSLGQDGSGWGCYGQLYNAAGVPVGSEFRLNTATFGDQIVPLVSMTTDGFIAVWGSAAQDGDGMGVFARRYNASGVPQGAEFQVNTFTTSDQRNGCVAMDANNNFVIVWESLGQDGSGKGIYGKRFDATGAALSSEFLVNSYTLNDQAFPFVAKDSVGNFVVAWTSTGQDGLGDGVFGKRFDSAGNPLAVP